MLVRRLLSSTWKRSSAEAFQKRHCSSLIQEAREKLGGLGEGKVSLEKDDNTGIAIVTLQHGQKKNALSGSMMVQLADITADLSSWQEGKGVILQAEGDFFCSGGDLTTVRVIANPDDGLLMSTFMHDTLTHFHDLPFITVCLVHGKALGGGAELTTAADFRVFSRTGEVSFVQGRMGVVTGWGGGTRLVKLLGSATALDLMTTCKKLDCNQASALGFANLVVNTESRLEDTISWLQKRIPHDPEVVQAMKRIVAVARDASTSDSLLNERRNFSPLWGGPANQKALSRNIKHK